MRRTTPKTLMILAGLVWSTGGIILMVVGIGRLGDALESFPGGFGPWAVAAAALLLGALKARLVFVRFGRRNRARIEGLESPRIWQFFPAGFFAALALMIASAGLIHRLAGAGGTGSLIAAAIDLAVGAALLGSLDVWLKK